VIGMKKKNIRIIYMIVFICIVDLIVFGFNLYNTFLVTKNLLIINTMLSIDSSCTLSFIGDTLRMGFNNSIFLILSLLTCIFTYIGIFKKNKNMFLVSIIINVFVSFLYIYLRTINMLSSSSSVFMLFGSVIFVILWNELNYVVYRSRWFDEKSKKIK
jgi:hypothetical protein